MARIDLPHVNGIIGRDGRVRYYFRKRGCKNVRLPGIPGSAEFMEAYRAASGKAAPIVIGASRTKVGTVAATVGMYLASAGFANLADETRRTRRNVLERFRSQYGDLPVALIEQKHVQGMIDAKAARRAPRATCSTCFGCRCNSRSKPKSAPTIRPSA
jgi:hypothetical protein